MSILNQNACRVFLSCFCKWILTLQHNKGEKYDLNGADSEIWPCFTPLHLSYSKLQICFWNTVIFDIFQYCIHFVYQYLNSVFSVIGDGIYWKHLSF